MIFPLALQTIALLCASSSGTNNSINYRETYRLAFPQRSHDISITGGDSVRDVIIGDFAEFKRHYELDTGNEMPASSVEYCCDVYDASNDAFLNYFDFDGSNGYILVSDSFEIASFSLVGDYPEIREFGSLVCFQEGEGFFSLKEDSLVFFSGEGDESGGCYDHHSGGNPIINGGTDSSGSILNLEAYVSSAHSDYVDTYDQFVMTGYHRKRMGDTTFYSLHGETEGNCVLNATYSMIENMASNFWLPRLMDANLGYEDLLFENELANSDPLYVEYGTHTKSCPKANCSATWGTSQWRRSDDNSIYSLSKMPNLYRRVRTKALTLGYTVDGFQYSRVVDLFSHALGTEGYAAESEVKYDFLGCENLVHDGFPVFIGTTGSSRYHDHGMSIYGYHRYTVTTGWWVFTQTENRYMFLVDDGYTDSATWYDPTCATGNTFVAIKRNTLTWPTC